LPNGNVFVNWGQAGAITEFDSESGQVLFHAYLDSEPEGQLVQSYRGFRLNWIGTPAAEPAITAVRTDEELSVYVSWNGDTETKLWKFYDATDRSKLLGESFRTSFETKFAWKGNPVDRIFAEAIDSSGKALVKTKLVSTANVRKSNRGLDAISSAPATQISLGGQEF
jgi:hypothetical protein